MQTSGYYAVLKIIQRSCSFLVRIRHKKCDETRPACFQCVSAGWKCDFPPVITTGPRQLRMSHIRSVSLVTDPLLHQLSSFLHIGPIEVFHFEYFRHVCTKEFSLYFEAELHERVILRAAYAEPCIMHAVLAIGALTRDQNTAHKSQILYFQLGSASEYLTEQYNLAIRTLNQRSTVPYLPRRKSTVKYRSPP